VARRDHPTIDRRERLFGTGHDECVEPRQRGITSCGSVTALLARTPRGDNSRSNEIAVINNPDWSELNVTMALLSL
jgi:hypothetical protein